MNSAIVRVDAPPTYSRWAGAVAGAISSLAFVIVHDLFIVDIWAQAVPMIVVGAICGVSLVWSYSSVSAGVSAGRWLAFNAAHIAVLFALALVSLWAFEPRFTMAEMMVSPDPLADLLPPAVPLMGAAVVVGTAAVWASFGRNIRSLPSLLVTQALLVFFIGHNMAILGLVALPGRPLAAAAPIFWVTLFLGGSFALAFLAISASTRIDKRHPTAG